MSRYVLYILFFSWAIISILTTPLFFSPANAPVRDLATSMEKCQTVGKKPNCSFQPQRGGGGGAEKKPDCLWWKLRTIPGYNPMGFIWGQSSGISYLFFSAHLSPVLNRFSLFFSLANTLNKNGTWVVTIVPSSQEVSSLEEKGDHLKDSPSPGCRTRW